MERKVKNAVDPVQTVQVLREGTGMSLLRF